MNETIVLVAHGSRDPEAAEEFLRFAADVQAHLNGTRVEPAFLELTGSSILDAIDRAVADGVARVVVLPLLLVPAGHQKNDVPAAVNAARAKYPHVEFRYGAHLGVDARLLEVMDERIREVEAAAAPCERADTAVLLVGRGSSDPDGNSDVYKVARLLWEGRGFRTVEVCFVGITFPRVKEGMARCALLGVRRIIVLPYFFFTGVLIKRIRAEAVAQRVAFPHIEILNAGYLGIHPKVREVLLQRLEEAVHGRVVMSCDLCKYRHRMAGFEEQVGMPQFTDHDHGLRTGYDHAHDHEHGHGHDHGS